MAVPEIVIKEKAVICHECGRVILPEIGTLAVFGKYLGLDPNELYYFCSDKCLDKFDEANEASE